ncbi:hypothetical protein AB0L17_14815 [Streptomyces cellulosae]
MVLIPPVQPMLAEAHSELPPERALPGGLALEQKPDGYRALLFAGPGGHAHLQCRNGSDLSPAFPEIAAAGRALRVPLVLDGELVAAAEGCLDFGQLQQRARRRGAGARLAARDNPAHLIVLDILNTADGPLLKEPYRAGAHSLRSSSPTGYWPTRSCSARPRAAGRPRRTGSPPPGALRASPPVGACPMWHQRPGGGPVRLRGNGAALAARPDHGEPGVSPEG